MSGRVEEFFAYARERHAIYLRRAAGAPAPWTEDPILQQYRFCNVFRELDATTVWFRENVRDPLRDRPEVLLATVVFRLFNRIATGEAIFQQPWIFEGKTAWDLFLEEPDIGFLRNSILAYCGKGPYTTGSYMTKTPTGMNKLDGMLQVIEWFANGSSRNFDRVSWAFKADELIKYQNTQSLRGLWEYLIGFPFIGDFTAYEIVTDLRHTALLDRAPDINTWANPGPGAKRGLNAMHGRPLKSGVRREIYIEEMTELLALCWNRPDLWPQYQPLTDLPAGPWPAWELREVEHTLCEFFKYERARTTGQGTRQRFRGGVR